MADWEIATVNVVWKEGWRCVGQIMRERGSWCWWVNKFPDPPSARCQRRVGRDGLGAIRAGCARCGGEGHREVDR
jgi:hypothetical protein